MRSRTTREKVGQAIRAALKKREQHDSQFAQARKNHGSSHSLSQPEPKTEPNSTGGTLPPTSPPDKLHASSPRTSPFSPSVSHERVAKLRHDFHTGNQDLRYFDTVPILGRTNVPPSSAFSSARPPLYTGTSSVHDFGYNPSHLEFRRQSDGFGAGRVHGTNDSLFVARQDISRSSQLGSTGFLSRLGLGERSDEYSLFELEQGSRGVSRREGQHRPQQQQLKSSGLVAVAQTGGSPFHQSPSVFPEMTDAVFGGHTSPGLHNSRFHSIADAHQIVSQRLSPTVSTGFLRETDPSTTEASMPLSIRNEETKSTPPPAVREGLHEN